MTFLDRYSLLWITVLQACRLLWCSYMEPQLQEYADAYFGSRVIQTKLSHIQVHHDCWVDQMHPPQIAQHVCH